MVALTAAMGLRNLAGQNSFSSSMIMINLVAPAHAMGRRQRCAPLPYKVIRAVSCWMLQQPAVSHASRQQAAAGGSWMWVIT